ncbi:MAG: hypothetical protein K9I85_04250 [Saprospiraceae bacterium]|nr:hypothetical protein [Saprospiraceae bacterium]
MPTVKFTYALKRFFPDLRDGQIEADNLTRALYEVDQRYPGLRSYILDEQGRLRKHVQIYLDGDPIQDREGLSDQLGPDTEIYLMQALSGG